MSKLIGIGVGPGDPELLTIKAVRRIREADVICLPNASMEGKTAAFLTVGDPTTYSTFTYILKLAQNEGFEIEIISGVTSYAAVAARLGIALCESGEELHIGTSQSDMETFTSLPGTKIIMKSGHGIREVKEMLRKAEAEKGAGVYAVTDCGLPGEKVFINVSK